MFFTTTATEGGYALQVADNTGAVVDVMRTAGGTGVQGTFVDVAAFVADGDTHIHAEVVAGSVKSSVLFPRVKVGENATVEYAIVDKGVEIAEGVVIRGTAEDPIVVKKGQKVTEDIIR